MTRDLTGEMEGHGAYDQHSLAQHSAGSFGMPLLERAIHDLAPLARDDRAVTVADLGAAGGRNELDPMGAAIAGLRSGGVSAPVLVVHTDIPTNDFTTLFETIENSPNTYLHQPEVYAFAAGRSFYERIFPASSMAFGWSAVAVHWLSRVPQPIPDHVYCAFATGAARDALVHQSAADWDAFLGARAAELRDEGQVVVVGGAATDDGASGAEALMDALNDALRDAVAAGRITEAGVRGHDGAHVEPDARRVRRPVRTGRSRGGGRARTARAQPRAASRPVPAAVPRFRRREPRSPTR